MSCSTAPIACDSKLVLDSIPEQLFRIEQPPAITHAPNATEQDDTLKKQSLNDWGIRGWERVRQIQLYIQQLGSR